MCVYMCVYIYIYVCIYIFQTSHYGFDPLKRLHPLLSKSSPIESKSSLNKTSCLRGSFNKG